MTWEPTEAEIREAWRAAADALRAAPEDILRAVGPLIAARALEELAAELRASSMPEMAVPEITASGLEHRAAQLREGT
jgi:hypothetical protein